MKRLETLYCKVNSHGWYLSKLPPGMDYDEMVKVDKRMLFRIGEKWLVEKDPSYFGSKAKAITTGIEAGYNIGD